MEFDFFNNNKVDLKIYICVCVGIEKEIERD